jgi:Family of unknown function (DUF5924)
MRRFWSAHRRLLWMLHSVWALGTGTTVVLLAHARYALVLWVGVFLALTWVSTLYFGGGRRARRHGPGAPPPLAHEVTSYLTRVMYQETLFFLLPFYTYSTVVRSPNVVFLALLGGLAIFSCLDLVFDRWLRTRPSFGLAYFAIVAFAALNLLVPLVFGVRVRFATPVAALVAVAAAAPLALRAAPRTRGMLLRFVLAGAGFLTLAVGVPALVPPVPLRLQRAMWASAIDRPTLALRDTLRSPASSVAAGPSLAVRLEVFAPTDLPTQVALEWKRDGVTVRESRPIDITANRSGFRVWDAWHPAGGVVPPGEYEVVLRTRGNRVFGVARLRVTPE